MSSFELLSVQYFMQWVKIYSKVLDETIKLCSRPLTYVKLSSKQTFSITKSGIVALLLTGVKYRRTSFHNFQPFAYLEILYKSQDRS